MSHISFYYSLNDDARNWTWQIMTRETVYGINSKKGINQLDAQLKKLIKNKNQDQAYQIILSWLKQNQP